MEPVQGSEDLVLPDVTAFIRPVLSVLDETVLYRVLFHHFDRFLVEYEDRFEREYGFFRPIVKEVVEKYLDSFSTVGFSKFL